MLDSQLIFFFLNFHEEFLFVFSQVLINFKIDGIQVFSILRSQRAFMKYRMPLREIVVDFYNELKSLTSGYASFDYEDSE